MRHGENTQPTLVTRTETDVLAAGTAAHPPGDAAAA